jgi:hypothetical protein
MTYGPWSPLLDEDERRRQLRCMAGLVAVLAGSGHAAVAALRKAELDGEALARARRIFETLPTLARRRALSVFGAVCYRPATDTPSADSH